MELVVSVVSLATAIVAVSIAAAQWYVARQRLVLDLYEKRFSVYMDVRKIVSELTQLEKLSDEALPNELIANARFLFGDDVVEIVEELHRLVGIIETASGLQEKTAARREMRELFGKANIVFSGYLKMDARHPKHIRWFGGWLNGPSGKRSKK